jgi:hypothetical protein
MAFFIIVTSLGSGSEPDTGATPYVRRAFPPTDPTGQS